MELYIYETPEGNVADFRPYLDGFDHSFADHRELQPSDRRFEKVSNLKHPTYQYDLAGKLRFIGHGYCDFFLETVVNPNSGFITTHHNY